MDFQVVVDSTFLELGVSEVLSPADNKRVLSIVNDYEDGEWRFEKFQSFVWDNIAETALSHQEREILKAQPHSLLTAAAKNLRLTDAENDIGKGSELAEIVLYGIMKHKYGALPVVPKIFYKQNSQDNAKGADSVHIVIEGKDDFSLWFGEAKFYNSIEDTRLTSIVQSVKNTLNTDKLKKENSIIINLSDIDRMDISEGLKMKIKESLAHNNSIDAIKHKLNIPILLLHECQLTESANEITSEYITSLKEYHKERAFSYFKKQINGLKDIFKYSEIKFHLILFPVPKKDPIVSKFVGSVAFHKS